MLMSPFLMYGKKSVYLMLKDQYTKNSSFEILQKTKLNNYN